MKKTILCLAVLALLAGSGCASTGTGPEQARLRARVAESTGVDPLPGQEPEKAQEAIERLLSDGLSREEAVRIGLAGNPDFQSRLEEIGLAKADLVQAGLPQNPRFRGLFRWPEEGELNYELELGFNLARLWRIPLASGAASLDLEMTLAQLGHEAVHLAGEIERAFDLTAHLQAALGEKERMSERSQALAREMGKRREFGYEPEDAVHGAKVEAVEAQVRAIRTRTELVAARAGLVRLLGLDPGSREFNLIPPEPPSIPHLPPLESLLAHALKNRADIQAARLRIQAAGKRIGLARSEFIEELEVGFNYEKESDGNSLYGPEVGLEVPLFDLNQGGVGRAQALARRAAKMLRAREALVRRELALDLAGLEAAKAAYRALETEIIPLRTQSLDYTRKYVALMQLNRTRLLEAELNLSQAKLEREEALRELRAALSSLKRDLGGKWPGE